MLYDDFNELTNMLTLPLSLGFEDVAIQQGFNVCKSRNEVDLTSEVIRGVKLAVPLISANMSTVTDPKFADLMINAGGLGVLHRALSVEDRLAAVDYLAFKGARYIASSIGVGENEFEVAKLLVAAGCDVLVIDIAHGYCQEVLDLCKKLKQTFMNDKVKVVIGNTTNLHMMEAADKVGADAVKVGIGQGAACSTKDTAGCTEKQFSAVYKFKKLSKEYGLPIISDGGIKKPSDFSLAIAAGANSVMAGSIFARCPESAAKVEYVDYKPKKVYAGMASKMVQEQWRGKIHNDCAEGKTVYLDLGESLSDLMARYAGALRSGITYAGARDIDSFHERVRFVRFK